MNSVMKNKSFRFGIHLTSLALVIFSVSCSKDKSAPPAKKIVPQSKTELTDFAFKFDIDKPCVGYCNDFSYQEKCVTDQKFDNKEDYCNGLMDAQLNNGCARNERRDAFVKNCGPVFSEINVGGYTFSGEDPRRGFCSYYIPQGTGTEYCEALRDENANAYCGWDQRRTLFKKYGCDTDMPFSNLPEELMTFNDPNVTTFTATTSPPIKVEGGANSTFKTLRKRFVFNPAGMSRKILITNLSMHEDNCEVLGQARFDAFQTTLGGTASPTHIDLVASDPFVSANQKVELQMEVKTPGLCKNLTFSYMLELRDPVANPIPNQ